MQARETQPPMQQTRNMLVLRVATGTPSRVDMLCATCSADAVFDIPLLDITEKGVSEIGRLRICDDCHARATCSPH